MTIAPPIRIFSPTGDRAGDTSLLTGTLDYLGREEIVNTILLSGLLARERFDPRQHVFVAKREDAIVAVAAITPGFYLLLSHVEDEAAINPLAAAVHQRPIVFPGVMGLPGAARAFAEHWASVSGGSSQPGMRQRILAARAVRAPAAVAGRARPFRPADHPFLVSWLTAYNVEVDGVSPEVARRRSQDMLDRVDERSGGVLWLDEAGTPVSVACYKAPTTNGIRIGPVFTPAEHRRRGYAGAVTAATTQLMLDRGYAFACLYTDAANATANHVYESIGYELVSDSIQYRFSGETA